MPVVVMVVRVRTVLVLHLVRMRTIVVMRVGEVVPMAMTVAAKMLVCERLSHA